MKNYRTPGVYIEKISSLPASVVPVETAIPAFIGYTEKACLVEDQDLHLVPQRISSLIEYERFFGGPRNETGIQVIINTITSPAKFAAKITALSNYMMFNQVRAFYNNGGEHCYIISVGTYREEDDILPADLRNGLGEVAKVDEVTLITFPDGPNTADPGDYYDVMKAALDQCEMLRDRFVVMDVVIDRNNPLVDHVQVFRNFDFGVKDTRKFGAAYYPYVETRYDYHFKDDDVTVNIDGVVVQLDELESQDNALYNQARAEINTMPMILPPSGSVLGIYASVDKMKGVWKAPANVNIDSAIKPVIQITDEDQESLNVDPIDGKSINAIRSFTGRGTAIVWGARTLAGNENEWRYISVRRFFNMAEESVKKSTAQFVFEPNDINTWTRVRSMIANFLTQQWRAGALLGSTPEKAYFVKVGLNETMTEFDIADGRMIIEIGMAMLRPAEFIILRLSHNMLQQA